MFLVCVNIGSRRFLFLRLSKKEEVFLLLQKDLRREKELRKTLEAEVTSTF